MAGFDPGFVDPNFVSKLLEILFDTLYIVAYIFLYLVGSVAAGSIGVAVAHIFERLLLRQRGRSLKDWDSTAQSLAVLFAVLGFLTTAECLFALHLFGKNDLTIPEQVGTAVFGTLIFAAVCIILMLAAAGAKWIVGRVMRFFRPSTCSGEIARILEDEDGSDYGSVTKSKRKRFTGIKGKQRQGKFAAEEDTEANVQPTTPKETWIKMTALSSVRNIDHERMNATSSVTLGDE